MQILLAIPKRAVAAVEFKPPNAKKQFYVEDALRRESSVPVELGHHLDETSGVNLGRPRGVGLLYPSSSTSRR